MSTALTIQKVLLVAVGGALGSVLRYTLSGWIQDRMINAFPNWTLFPTGTLVINITGCFVAGLLGSLLIREEYRVAVMVGILGGYTTFSAFGRETFMLANGNQLWFAALNILLSNTLGLVAVWLGYRVAQRWLGVS